MRCTALRQTELNFEFNQVRTPTNGYITNLRLSIGRYVVANQSVVALVDTASYWVDGHLNENFVTGIQSGDQAGSLSRLSPASQSKAS